MTWDRLQQLIRIVAYVGGSYWVGDSVAAGEMYQAAVSGAVSVAAFLWWWYHEMHKA